MSKSSWKHYLWRWRGVLIAAPSATFFVLLLRWSGALQGLEWATLDWLTRSQPLVQDDRIVIVELRESDKQHGFPLPDKTLAQLLNQIKQQQPRAIGLDLYRDLPVGNGYRDLVKVFQSTPNLIGIQKIGGTVDAARIEPPLELAKLGQIASNDAIVDGDGKLRRGLLFISDREDNSQPSLGMAMALFYLQGVGIEPAMPDTKTIQIGKTVLPIFHGNDGGYVRADDRGYQLLLNHPVQPSSFKRFSVDQVLRGEVPANWGRDRIVLIGPTAESLNDFFFTPTSYQGLFTSELRIPGVYIHAQLTSKLLNATLDRKPFLQSLPDHWEHLIIALGAIGGAVLVWQLRYANSEQESSFQQSLGQSFKILVVSSGLLLGSYVGYRSHLWLPIVPTFMSFAGSALMVTAYQAQKTNDLRKTLGRYLTKDVVSSLLENPDGLTLTGERRKVTTLISDIRGFTSLSERYPAEQIVQMLNLYLAIMTKVIQQYGGTINDLTGDGIIVFFGAPLSRSQDTECAVACALAMQKAMTAVNQQNQDLGFPTLEMGIGLNTGEVVVGNIGSENYLKYTAIGSHVNLAARVESFTVGGQVLITESTLDDIRAIAQITGELEAQMKGVAKPVTLYEVSGIEGEYNIFLDRSEAASITEMPQPLQLQYGLLAGKHLSAETFTGELVALSSKGGEIRSTHQPKVLSNLKIELAMMPETAGDYPIVQEIYAKVINQPGRDTSTFWVQFTMITPELMTQLEAMTQLDAMTQLEAMAAASEVNRVV
jgi:adenylate cyclase